MQRSRASMSEERTLFINKNASPFKEPLSWAQPITRNQSVSRESEEDNSRKALA